MYNINAFPIKISPSIAASVIDVQIDVYIHRKRICMYGMCMHVYCVCVCV